MQVCVRGGPHQSGIRGIRRLYCACRCPVEGQPTLWSPSVHQQLNQSQQAEHSKPSRRVALLPPRYKSRPRHSAASLNRLTFPACLHAAHVCSVVQRLEADLGARRAQRVQHAFVAVHSGHRHMRVALQRGVGGCRGGQFAAVCYTKVRVGVEEASMLQVRTSCSRQATPSML